MEKPSDSVPRAALFGHCEMFQNGIKKTPVPTGHFEKLRKKRFARSRTRMVTGNKVT